MTKNEKKGYVFSYHLTPERTGTIAIPSIEIRSGSDTAKTNPLVIVSRKPVETDHFKLKLTLSKDTCYVGEPIILTVTWYIGKNVNNISFNLPVLYDIRFDFADPEKSVPFLLQGPFSHVPCQVVTLERKTERSGILLTCSRGYARDMTHAILAAGEEFGLQPAGETAFTRWIETL